MKKNILVLCLKTVMMLIVFHFNFGPAVLFAPAEESTQEELKALSDFTTEVSDPALSFDEKIEKYKDAFETLIKEDTPQNYQDNFISSFLNFVSTALASAELMVEQLEAVFALYNAMRESKKFDLVEREKLLPLRATGRGKISAEMISNKIEAQKKISKDLLDVSQIADFNSALSRYRDISRKLNSDVNWPYLQRIVNAFGHLSSSAVTKDQKEKLKNLLDESKKIKFFSHEQLDQIAGYSDKLKEDIKEIEEKIKGREEKVAEEEVPEERPRPPVPPARPTPVPLPAVPPTPPPPPEAPPVEPVPVIPKETLDQRIEKIMPAKTMGDKIQAFLKALELVGSDTTQEQKSSLVKILVDFFNARGNLKKEELGALKGLFENALQNSFLLAEHKDPKKSQKAAVQAWLLHINEAYNLTTDPHTYFESLINSMQGKEFSEQIKLCNNANDLMTDQTLPSNTVHLIRALIGLYNERDNMNYDQLKSLKSLLEEALGNEFIKPPSLLQLFPFFIKSVEVSILIKDIDQKVLPANMKKSLSDQIQVAQHLVEILEGAVDEYEVQVTFNRLLRIFDGRIFLEKAYEYWSRKRKWDEKNLDVEIETLKSLKVLFDTVNQKIGIFRPDHQDGLKRYSKIIDGAVILAKLTEKDVHAKKIDACNSAADLIGFDEADSNKNLEKNLMFQILYDLNRDRFRMTIPDLKNFNELIKVLPTKRKLFVVKRNNILNTWIDDLEKMITEGLRASSRLLIEVGIEKNYPLAFHYFQEACTLFFKDPALERESVKYFPKAITNLYQHRNRLSRYEKDLPRKLEQLKELFEKISKRKDILVTPEQRETIGTWLAEIDKRVREIKIAKASG